MSNIKLPGRDTIIYKDIRSHLRLILDGTMLVVDPSMGSLSSMPGYAVYKSGRLMGSGVLKIDPRGEKWERLRELHRLLRNLSLSVEPNVCVYENVPVSAHGGRSQVSHASLLMAVGVTLAAVQADAFIGLAPMVWKSRVHEGYEKGDEADAIAMGYIVHELAGAIAEKDSPETYKASK